MGDPLETFKKEERRALLDDFRSLLTSNNELVQNITMHVAVPKSASGAFKKAVMASASTLSV